MCLDLNECLYVCGCLFGSTCDLLMSTCFVRMCNFLMAGVWMCVFVMVMRMEVCWWSNWAANGPAGCENLFYCLSLFSTLVWPSCWVCSCVHLCVCRTENGGAPKCASVCISAQNGRVCVCICMCVCVRVVWQTCVCVCADWYVTHPYETLKPRPAADFH